MHQFSQLPVLLRIYIATVTLTAVAVLVASPVRAFANGAEVVPLALLVLLTAAVAVTKVPLGLPQQWISLDVAVIGLAQLTLHTPAAALCAGIGALVTTYCNRPRGDGGARQPVPVYRAVFNVAACVIAGYAAGVTLDAVQGWLVPALGNQAVVPALAAWAVVYFTLNTSTVAVALGLSRGVSSWQLWREHCLWTVPGYVAAASVAGIVTVLWSWLHLFALLPLPLIYFVYAALRAHGARAELQQQHIEELNRMMESVMASLGMAIEAKDHYTREHIVRVQRYAVALAEAAGVDNSQREAVRLAALVHDVGKIAIPERILCKRGKLTAEEFTRMKAHVTIGTMILEPVRFPYPVVEAVNSHHERWDGLGYPFGLSGDEIPIGGRIIAVADCFDALTRDRPYRKAVSADEALVMMREVSGTQLDPTLVELFTGIYAQVEQEIAAEEAQTDLAAHPRQFDVADEVFTEIAGATTADLSGAFDLIDQLIHAADGEMLPQALDGLRDMVPCGAAVVFEVSPAGSELSAATVLGAYRELLQGMSIRVGEGVSGRAAGDQKPFLNASAMLDVGRVVDPDAHIELSSVLAVPVVIQEKTVAVLSFYHRSYDVYREHHLAVVQAVARHLAAALHLRRQSTQEHALAMTDAGTGLHNLRYFIATLDERLPAARLDQRPLAVLLMDLDDFKPINDQYGHLAGDEAIAAVARQLAQCVRRNDVVCRYAGDEFVFVLDDAGREDAEAFAHRVRQAVREVRTPGGEPLSCSIGTALFPQDGADVRSLLTTADKRMYEEKVRAKHGASRSILPA